LSYLVKLQEALNVLYEEFASHIMNYSLSEERPVLTIIFYNGLILHIRYNDFEEYSYQLTFSSSKYDRIRFDNYDKNWKVSTTPHHLHKRGSKKVLRA